MLFEDKRTDTTDEIVPDEFELESEESEESEPTFEKRKLGDSLRLGKKSELFGDEFQKFGRHSRLFEQMRLGKRSESGKLRDKKKLGGKRLQLVNMIHSHLFSFFDEI